jgi:aryl-alcohol dehydrogenase-like predicted oxidoreductase
METTTLGRTGAVVSVAGLGCGGHSRLGLAKGKDEAHASRIVAHALDLGINFIDTARAYGTESAVGKGIAGKRDQVFISTKSAAGARGRNLTAQELTDSLEKSLQRLGTDYVDLFNLHGVQLRQYPHCVEELVPEMQRQQQLGKIRFLGITEVFAQDTGHVMLQRALPDNLFDVIMVGFNMLNPSARERVFPLTMQHNVGTQIMFAVRRALSHPEALREVLTTLMESGEVDASALSGSDPLALVTGHPEVGTLVEAAYRFCRHEPGAHVVLTGTSSTEHLQQNVQAILAPPLPESIQTRLREIFGNVSSVSGN